MSNQKFFETKASLERLKESLEMELAETKTTPEFYEIQEKIHETERALVSYNESLVVDF